MRRSTLRSNVRSTCRSIPSHPSRSFYALALVALCALLAWAAPASAAAGGWTVIPARPPAAEDSAGGTSASPSGSPASGASGARILAAGTRYATEYYVNEAPVAGPTVVIVGGMHGNETAGYLAARRLVSVKPKRGTIIVIPEANKLGVKAGQRTGGHPGDLNRDFPTSSSDAPDSTLAKAIWDLMKKYRPDYLFDLHEGYDFHKLNSKSVGQSIIYYPKGDAQAMAKAMQQAVNKTISNSRHHYSLLKYPVKGSLARAAGAVLGTTSMILETSRKQPLETRVRQHVTMVEAALKRLNMI